MADPAIEWLLRSRDPSVRFLALTEVLGEGARSRAVREARSQILAGPRVRALLAGQRRNGGFGAHPYLKWTGAHWRLVSLVELAIPPDHAGARAAAETVLAWLTSDDHLRSIARLPGPVRIHASQEGNALAVCTRLGMGGDPRVRALATRLVETQWPDGGWNCDRRPEASCSSVYETVTPMWGLAEYARATGDAAALAAAGRAAEVLLERRLFRRRSTGKVIDPRWLKLQYPLYWHYDVLHALVMLARAGALGDPRARDALGVVESKRRADGSWRAEASYWRAPGSAGSNVEAVDWRTGRGPSEMITLNALRVLRAAGRLAR